jgi:hypothetical protein
MRRRPVDSSVIRSVGYEPTTSILEIEFQTDRRYRYFAVPRSVYLALLDAPSPGTFFNKHIRDRYPDEAI